MQYEPTYPSAGVFLSQVASMTPLRNLLHPSIGGKQKLFVRRFVKGYSDERNDALIPFLQQNVPLGKFDLSIQGDTSGCVPFGPGLAKPKRNFDFEVNGRFVTT